jgi:hypothetical protein
MPPESLREMLRAAVTGRPVKVDREKNVLRGYVVAQAGPFKSQGRGEFNEEGLRLLEQLGNSTKQGIRSRFTHPTMCDDGLGNYLGRARDFFMSEAVNADGVKVPAVRADLFFDETALQEGPKGGKPLGLYVMDLAESDPDAISSSIVVRPKKMLRRKADGTPEVDASTGEELPPLWYPEKLYGSDIVDTGDAVDGLLSADGLRGEELWRGTEMLDGMFDGLSREEVAERLRGWSERYLAHRFGEVEPVPATEKHNLVAALQETELALRVRRNRSAARAG